jgi:ferrous iron transport protein B
LRTHRAALEQQLAELDAGGNGVSRSPVEVAASDTPSPRPDATRRPREAMGSSSAGAPAAADSSELSAEESENDRRTRLETELAEVEDLIAGQYLRNSYLGRAGRLVEPLVRPLGWDWRLGCAALASFPAREVVIATLGVIYNLGDDEDENSEPLAETLRAATWEGSDQPVFNIPVALSVMVFFALCAQCASTLAVLRRETNSWRWPAFTFVYMTTLAYLGALLTYQVGRLFLTS